MMSNKEQVESQSSTITNVPTTPTIVVSPKVAPLITPGGTKEWHPICPNELKPAIGMKFNNLEKGLEFYKGCSFASGFNTRKSTTKRQRRSKELKYQYILCNKEGYKEKRKTTIEKDLNNKEGENNEEKSSIKRKRLVTRVGCKMNIGPVTTFRLMKEIVGGYENIGSSKEDFKNFHRDLKAYIQGSDAQMFVNNFTNKKLMWSAFFFDFEMDEDYCLCRALWADPLCKKSYALFSDMVSFDTTYQTNRYNMVFTPFTGVDHHKNCINFAAGFIAKEDIVSFEWLFRSFLKAMGGNEPNCMITYQDQAMKIAIRSVFKKTEHQFCMWHIMKKLLDKVEKSIMQEETGFLKKLCACVWHLEIEPAEFEERWNKVMIEYHLEQHEWLGYMYKIRDKWIPAYFRDVFLGGIMRTTSRSESENNFFCSFTNPHVSLVEFYLRYEAAIDAQRHTQGQNDNDSKHKYPECKTPLGIEKHASHLYTNSVFYEFQYEKENELELATVSEGNRTRTFDVVFNPTNYDTTCSCKLFHRQGIPCRHMIWVWKEKRFETIPEQYMLHRWTTMALKKPIFDLGGNLLQQCANIIDKKKLLNDLWSEIHTCVSLAEGKDEDNQDLVINL
ncbi:protein FAR1-RELATED SEQUENCE 5-like [Chenopodium quinoa]|uniref:protein FAR1-RELATED SEQUENCE 5-like n=1 Tax=Chenopodium quinoa TaxID=63459 RepID=UPI000B78EC5F|nr:protein FAR1-RELATED SEQUENCE 5-like [Chenopodium quinoa]